MQTLLFNRFLIILIFFTLNQSGEAAGCILSASVTNYSKKFIPQYAKHFSILYSDGFKILKSDKTQYYLVKAETHLSRRECLDENKIIIPVKKVVFSSTTYLPSLELIQEVKSLVGFLGVNYIYSPQFDRKNIIDLGETIKPELMLKLNSDLFMGYEENFNDVLISNFKKFKIPFVVNHDLLEQSPLARAEWIVFIASFFNKESEAQKIFDEMAKKYNEIKQKQKKANLKKKILVGDIQNGKWVMPGGESDFGQLLKDAGGEMLFASTSRSTQYIPLELIREKKLEVDLWLPNNSWRDARQIQSDSRYQFIKVKQIYNFTNRVNSNGANDFWEQGVQRPDLLIEDIAQLINNNVQHLNWYKKI